MISVLHTWGTILAAAGGKAKVVLVRPRSRTITPHPCASTTSVSYFPAKLHAGSRLVITTGICRDCERAATIAIAAGKKAKTVEIRFREISRRLNEIARLVPFDDRAYIEKVRLSVEALRTKLLDHMFKKNKVKIRETNAIQNLRISRWTQEAAGAGQRNR